MTQDNHWLNLCLHICKVYVSRLKFWQQPVKFSNVAVSKDKYWNSTVTRMKKAKQYWNKRHACCQLHCRYLTRHMNRPKPTNTACLNSLPRVHFPMVGVLPLKDSHQWSPPSTFDRGAAGLQSTRGQTASLSVCRKESILQHTKCGEKWQIDGTAVTLNQQGMNKLWRLS